MSQQLQQERGVRHCERNHCAGTKARIGGGPPSARAENPLQPVEKAMVRQTVPLQPMKVHGGAYIHLQPMEDILLAAFFKLFKYIPL